MACVCVASENMNGTKTNLTGFSYISEFFVTCTASQNGAPCETSLTTDHSLCFVHRSKTRRTLCPITPRVCWPASAPPWARAWTLTSRWSCCYWLCGCGCWGPPCRTAPLYSWQCYEVLLRWRERAGEKKALVKKLSLDILCKPFQLQLFSRMYYQSILLCLKTLGLVQHYMSLFSCRLL